MSRRNGSQRIRFWVGVVGAVLAVAGIAGIARATDNSKLLDVSATSLVVGSILIGLSILSGYRVTVDEAYKLGYDIGHEDGRRERQKKLMVLRALNKRNHKNNKNNNKTNGD